MDPKPDEGIAPKPDEGIAPKLDEGIAPKHCPLLHAECLQDACVFWIRSTESVRKNCAIVIIAQQLNTLAAKTTETRLS